MPRLPPTREPDVSTDQPSVIDALIERVVEKVVKFVTLECHANLIAAPSDGGTPIDTGFARASWMPAVGEMNPAVAGSRENVDGTAAQNGVNQIMMYHLGQGMAFVTSSVPYILKLNDGHSQQAPAGFVDAAVVRAVNSVESAFGGGL